MLLGGFFALEQRPKRPCDNLSFPTLTGQAIFPERQGFCAHSIGDLDIGFFHIGFISGAYLGSFAFARTEWRHARLVSMLSQYRNPLRR